MINASVKILSIGHGPVAKAGMNALYRAPKFAKKDLSLIKIVRRSGATIASNSIKASVNEGVPRIGK